MEQELNFDDITAIEIPVSVGGKKYILREASGDAAVKYRNAVLKCTKLGPEGKPCSIEGMADTEPYLVSLCLFVWPAENGQHMPGCTSPLTPVSLQTIRSWPQRIQKKLYAEAKRISGLDERSEADNGDKDSPKGSPSDTTDGSS